MMVKVKHLLFVYLPFVIIVLGSMVFTSAYSAMAEHKKPMDEDIKLEEKIDRHKLMMEYAENASWHLRAAESSKRNADRGPGVEYRMKQIAEAAYHAQMAANYLKLMEMLHTDKDAMSVSEYIQFYLEHIRK